MTAEAVSFPQELRERLAADFAGLETLSTGLADRAVAFVEGTGSSDVLAHPGVKNAAKVLELKWVATLATGRASRRELIRDLPRSDLGILFRLGRLLESTSPLRAATARPNQIPNWLEALLWESSEAQVYAHDTSHRTHLTFEEVEALLALAGNEKSLALRAAILDRTSGFPGRFALSRLEGFAAAAARQPAVVEAALAGGDAEERVHALEILARQNVDPAPHMARLVDLATGSAKKVREAALPLLSALPDAASAALLRKLEAGNGDERVLAAQLLSRLDPATATHLRAHLEKERSEKVRRAIEPLLATMAEPVAIELPAVVVPVPGRLPDATRAALRGLVDRSRRQAIEWHDAHKAYLKNDPRPEPITDEAFDAAIRALEAPRLEPRTLPRLASAVRASQREIEAVLSAAPLDVPLTVRILDALSLLTRLGLSGSVDVDVLLQRACEAANPPVELRTLAAIFDASGLDSAEIGWDCLRSEKHFDWGAGQLRPFFSERFTYLEKALGLRPYEDGDPRFFHDEHFPRALEIVASLPHLPEALAQKAWELALGPGKSHRRLAQKCVEARAGSEERIVDALRDGRQDVRAVAAEWLGLLDARAAVPQLEAALRKEKADTTRAAMIDALERLGVPAERLLDRGAFTAEAEKGLKKGLPQQLSWFPIERLPKARWADGTPVAAAVLPWLLVQSQKLGSPAPGVLLRRYVAGLHDEDRLALGEAVFAAWLEQDAAGSAIGSKGLLAVVAATGTPRVAPEVQRYLKEWHGNRAAQCKALLQMLAWLDDRSAIQVLLGTAVRFRTPGIRKEAELQAEALAERKGWTVDELADRTIPDAGFDERGEQVLDTGLRRFVLRLGLDLSLALAEADGKALKSLPPARSGEDADRHAAAKAQLASVKKQLKSTADMQRLRLYEAMCAGRSWDAADWNECLHRHPLVGRLAAGLVWRAERADEAPILFRPLGDGTLTDAADAAVTIPAGARVRLAHPVELPSQETAAWREHLDAYEIAPPFAQLTRPVRKLSEIPPGETHMRAFEGHLLEAFQLRGRATKLGWLRGAAEDGGIFYVYERNLPMLGLRAVLEFTGNSLPEENRTVALRALFFEGAGGRPQVLEQVPPILLSECWNDLAEIAAAGSGFDPDWEKKAAW